MAKNRSFSVTQPPVIPWLSFGIAVFFFILVVIEILLNPAPSTAILVITTLFVFLPCSLLILWASTFRIRVEASAVSVRRCFGLIRYNFDVSEITAVECITIQTNMGINKKITLRTANGKKVSIETLMVNSDKMMQYLEEYVDASKFRETTKTFRRRK